jgi:hypothetical protein
MISRRQFLATSLFAAAAAAREVRASPRLRRRLLVHVPATPQRPQFTSGIAFGFLEARRTAGLFAWEVERAANADSAHVVLQGNNVELTEAPLVLYCHPDVRRGLPHAVYLAPRPGSQPNTALWQPGLERFGAAQLNERYQAFARDGMTSDAWLGWFALKAATETVLRTQSTDPDTMLAYLRAPGTAFDGHKGQPLRFDDRGELQQPTYDVP